MTTTLVACTQPLLTGGTKTSYQTEVEVNDAPIQANERSTTEVEVNDAATQAIQNCTICIEEILYGDFVAKRSSPNTNSRFSADCEPSEPKEPMLTKCGHHFHIVCLKSWVQIQSQLVDRSLYNCDCPNCKNILTKTDLKKTWSGSEKLDK